MVNRELENYTYNFKFSSSNGELFENSATINHNQLISQFSKLNKKLRDMHMQVELASEITAVNLNNIFVNNKHLYSKQSFFAGSSLEPLIDSNREFAQVCCDAAAFETSPLYKTSLTIRRMINKFEYEANRSSYRLFIKASKNFLRKNTVNEDYFERFINSIDFEDVVSINNLAATFTEHTGLSFIEYCKSVGSAYKRVSKTAINFLKENISEALHMHYFN